MWWILSMIYSFMYNSLLDFVFFILVDVVAKTPLREATNDDEKRTIWLYESLILTAVSIGIYLLDHVPYLLLLLTTVTFIYTQLYGRIDFRYWWNLLKTRWEEYQQHEESMEHMREQLSRQRHPVQPNTTMPFPPYYQQVPPGGMGAYSAAGSDHSAHLVSQKQGLSQKEPDSWFWSRPSKWLSLRQRGPQPVPDPVVSRESPVTSRHGVPVVGRKLDDSLPQKVAWFDGKELRRRPLRPEGSTHLPKPNAGSPLASGAYSGTSTIKTKFMSAFGLNNQIPKPPGLKNNGQNLCFMNSIVQSLSRSPHLVTYLSVDAAKELECGVAESLLLTTFVELLQQCSLPVGSNDVSVLDHTTFRQSVSALNSSLMAPPGQGQVQQDAAEFLMWLLESVHNILNKNRKALQADKTNGSRRGEERFSSPTLAVLKFIYGDLNSRTIIDLKDACRREIELANGLENDSYAEPIQRLSDLEWLQHKQENESIIDDLFTGQLVEAYHCLTDNHISVNLQAFNILPVPIAAPREVSGVVYLEDCFTSFCHIEHLMGPDEMDCTYCRADANKSKKKGKKNSVNDVYMSSTPRTRSVTRNMSVDSAVQSPAPPPAFMSPIVGQRDIINDSGFHDNIFKTSTPIVEACQGVGNQTRQHIRDVQRRCLLRQLPECLAIQLMRFTYNQRTGRSKKIKAPVSIRIKDLNLTNIIYDTVTRREDLTAINLNHTYNLFSVCVHLGAESTNHGHYISYCLVDDKWYRFDDENVTEVNMEYELTTRELRENAYILFYKRVHN
ncbi:ubiquitin carboxyl-terminal hydrolase 33-like [Haliotis asinina]|uniref:ubiquitin carboxyl-terminal hydrolase 33-like n=1 Tax=Haliotis asinina TaxID=109174 RepID=UPI00353231A5